MIDWLIKKLGGFTLKEVQDATSRAQKSAAKLGYDNGHKEGFKKGRKALEHTPGWLKKEVHRKLDLMFKKDGFSDRARYRWLKEHSLTTSHMSEMGFNELMKVNKLLDEVTGSGNSSPQKLGE